MVGLGRMRWVWLVFLFFSPRLHAEPVHWRLLLETTHDVRTMLEDVDLGVEISPERREQTRRRLRVLSEDPQEARALVSYLFGEGKNSAHLFVVAYKSIQMKTAVETRYYDLLQEIGFTQLNDALGFTNRPGPAREFFLSCVQREFRKIDLNREPVQAILDSEGRLRSGGQWLKSASFTAMMMAGLGVGALAYNGLNYLGLRGLPVERVAGAIGAGIVSTVYGFQWLWPKVERPLAAFFLGKRYAKLFDACLQLMFLDVETAMPTLISMATQHGDSVLPQEAAALDAIISYQHPVTTDALVKLAEVHIEKGLMKRSAKILDEIIRRGPESEVGQFAVEIKSALEAKRQFEKELARLKRKYIGRNVFWSAVATLGGILGLELIEPNMINLTRAFVLQGIGLAGARMFFTKLWRRYPEEELRQKMAEQTVKLTKAFEQLLAFAQKKRPAGPTEKFDVPRISVEVLVALARNELPGHAGELLRQAAREALHQFDDDVAMSFLILEGHSAILRQAISKQEPPEQLKAITEHKAVQTKQCVGFLEGLGTESPPMPVTRP